MPAVADLDVPALEYMDPTLTGPRFEDALRELSERTWIARADPLGWIVLDHEAAAYFMRTKEATFPGRMIFEAQGVTSGPLYERFSGNLLGLDGDDHRRLRKLIHPAFTPQAADAYRPAMREQLAELYDAVAAAGRCDAVTAFAKPYPSRMIALVMGAPLEDAPRLEAWANTIQGQFDPIRLQNELAVLERAAEEFQDYARDLLASEGSVPFLAEADGLSEDERLNITSSVLVGGVDTTQAQLAHALRLFAEHPEQWTALAERPDELAAPAVEEVLRVAPIAPFTARITLEEIEFRYVTFPQGTLVFACAHTANREQDEAFDITADRGRAKPLTFGAGPHFCLGANLARAELQEALAFLALRLHDLALDGEPEYDTPLGVYGLRSLPIRFSA